MRSAPIVIGPLPSFPRAAAKGICCARADAAGRSAASKARRRSMWRENLFSLVEFLMIHADSELTSPDLTSPDPRRAALERWLAGRFPGERVALERASEDASFRRYFRARLADGRSFIAMDAPPEKEDC